MYTSHSLWLRRLRARQQEVGAATTECITDAYGERDADISSLCVYLPHKLPSTSFDMDDISCARTHGRLTCGALVNGANFSRATV